MGSDEHYPEEAPVHRVRVDPFSIDRYEVTNARFAEFVDATDYVTVAERPLDPPTSPALHARTWFRDRWCSRRPPARSTCAT